MDKQKLAFPLIFILITLITVSLFWKNSLLLSFLLILLAYLKHKLYPISKEFLCFVIAGLIGSLGESLVIFRGSWSYTSPNFFNIPLWLPLLWGLAGTTGIVLYEALIRKK